MEADSMSQIFPVPVISLDSDIIRGIIFVTDWLLHRFLENLNSANHLGIASFCAVLLWPNGGVMQWNLLNKLAHNILSAILYWWTILHGANAVVYYEPNTICIIHINSHTTETPIIQIQSHTTQSIKYTSYTPQLKTIWH